MKRSILALASGAFILGAAEFVMMGILPQTATAMHVSIPAAGHYISAYAIGVCVGTLILVFGRKVPPKHLIILFMAIATGMCQSLNLSVTSRSATTIVLAAFFGATISSAAYLPNNTGIIGLLMVKDMGVPFTWLGFYSENLPYQIGHALLAYTILHLFGGRELGEHISRCRACA